MEAKEPMVELNPFSEIPLPVRVLMVKAEFGEKPVTDPATKSELFPIFVVPE